MALHRFAKRIDGHLIRGCTDVAGVTVFVQQVNVSFFVVVGVILHLINDEHIALLPVGKTVLISNALCHFFGQFFFERCLLKSNFQRFLLMIRAEITQDEVIVVCPILDATHDIEVVEFKEFLQDGWVFFKVIPRIVSVQEML